MPEIACPGCQSRYNVPDKALGRKVRCKRCGESFLIAVPEEEELYHFENEEPAPPAPPTGSVGGGTALGGTALGSAVLPALSTASIDPTRASFRDDVPASQGLTGLVRDTGWSLILFTDVGAAVTFFFLAVAMVFYIMVGFFIQIAQLIILGWYYSYQLTVIESAAAGERELPPLNPEGGFFSLLLPLAKFLSVMFVSHLPFLVLLVYLAGSGSVPWTELATILDGVAGGDYQTAFGGISAGAAATITALMMALLFATLLQPMLFLCVAIGGIPDLVRIDLMLQTILRTPAAYGLVLLVFVVMAWAPTILAFFVMPAEEPGQWSGLAIGIEALVLWFTIYCDLVAMRVVGYYYHHCKDRFAWSWG